MSLTSAQKFLWVLAGVAALAFVWLVLWSDYRADRARTDAEPPFFAEFELTDHQGMVRTEEDFAGRWMLVFFGFTNCPDVCPTTLSEVAAVMDGLGDDAAKVQPIFITIDPERDTAPDGYTMGHTSHLFLFDPDAGFADSWPYGTPAEEILADLEERF